MFSGTAYFFKVSTNIRTHRPTDGRVLITKFEIRGAQILQIVFEAIAFIGTRSYNSRATVRDNEIMVLHKRDFYKKHYTKGKKRIGL